MDKNTVPENFTVGLALVDAIPVVLFGVNCILIGSMLGSILFILGAVACFLGGAGKVLWKFIVVLKKKNIWPLFIQMRILMPAGFLLMIIAVAGLAICGQLVFSWPPIGSVVCFALGIAGMVCMGVFAAKLDSSDSRSNWIEQLTNAFAQAMILVGLLIM